MVAIWLEISLIIAVLHRFSLINDDPPALFTTNSCFAEDSVICNLISCIAWLMRFGA